MAVNCKESSKLSDKLTEAGQAKHEKVLGWARRLDHFQMAAG